MKTYIAFISNGVIMESNNFKSLFRNVRFAIRMDEEENTAIFFVHGDSKNPIAGYHYHPLINTEFFCHGYRVKQPHVKLIFRETFMQNEYGVSLWQHMGLD